MIQANRGGSLTCRKININDLVRKARQEFVKQFVKSDIDINGQEIKLATSKTRFGGQRSWFVCPKCERKKGVVIQTEKALTCRKCLNNVVQ